MLERLKTMQIAGKLAAAEASFARITRATPGHLHGWLGLGYCAILKTDRDAGRAAFGRAAALPPGDEDGAIDCAIGLAHLGEVERARAVLARMPASARLRIALGEIEERHGPRTGALGCYQAAAALDPQADMPLRKLIDLHRRSGDRVAALAATDRLAALGPRHEATAWQARGAILRMANERDAALQAFARAAELAPTLDHPVLDWSREMQAAGREDEAAAVLAARPPSFAVELHRGEIALARRWHDAALGHLAAAHALDPKRPEPWARSAQLEADRGAFDAAHGFADRIEALAPEHRLAALRSRIAIFKAAGQEDEALAVNAAMVAAAPADAVLWAELGRQYRLTGHAAEARRAVQRAMDLDPANAVALAEALEQATANEEREAALAHCRRLQEMMPDHIGHAIRLARLLHDLDREAESAAVLRQAETRFGRPAELWGERIRLLRDSGESYAALREARLAQAAFPRHFGRWFDRFHMELRLSPVEAAEGCLDAAPAKTVDDELQLLVARSHVARCRGDDEGAIQLLLAALALKGHHRGALASLYELHLRNAQVAQAASCLARLTALQAPDRRFRSQPLGMSQSLQGQMLNEFRLDRPAMAELAAARSAATGVAQVAAHLPLVRKRPGHLASAFALLGALRRAGALTCRDRDEPAPRGHRPIPNIIGQFWDKPELSDELRRLGGSWRAQNPDHRYLLFNADTARTYLAWHFPPVVARAFRACGDATTQADLFRLAFLFREGGAWADMDDRCLAPLATFVPSSAEAFFWEEGLGSLGNNFMAAAPRHPIMRRALTMAVQAILRGDRDSVWLLSGPGLVTRAFAAEIAEAGDDWPSRIGRIAIMDPYVLSRYVAIHCRTAHKRLGQDWQTLNFARRNARSRNRPEPLREVDGDRAEERSEAAA